MKALFAVSLLLLAACQPPPIIHNYDPPRFDHLPTIELTISEVELTDTYKMPLVRPYVEHLFPVSLSQAVNQWSQDRLKAVGAEGMLELVILEASVVEVPLEKSSGIKGALTNDQSERYDATLIVEARLYDGQRALSASNARVEVRQSRSIAENTTIEERERLFYQLARGMVQLFDAEMERQMQQHFANHISMKR